MSQYQSLAIAPPPDAVALSVRLQQHVDASCGVGADRIVRQLLDQDRLQLASALFSGRLSDPLSVATRLVTVLNHSNVQHATKLRLSIAKVTRLFLELNCLQVHTLDVPAPDMQMLKERILAIPNQEVGLRHELICCVEALKLMDTPEVKPHLVQLSLAVQHRQTPDPIAPDWLNKGWHLRVFYTSWIGGLTANQPKNAKQLLKSLKGSKKFGLNMARVELCGDLLKKGSPPVQEIAREKLTRLHKHPILQVQQRAKQLLKPEEELKVVHYKICIAE